MAHDFGSGAHMGSEQARQLLQELAVGQPADVTAARELSSVRVQAVVVVRPADLCARRAIAARGVTSEVRRGGASCVLEEPIWVGSMFHLTFEGSLADFGPALAVCDRCVMLGDTAFDVHFRFTQELEPPPGPDGSPHG